MQQPTNVATVSVASGPQSVFATAVPGSFGSLSTLQKNAYAETCRAYGNAAGIRSALIMGNASPSSVSTEFPKGHVIHFVGDAVAQELTLSPHDYKCTVVCRVIPKDKEVLKDDFFTSKKAELNKAVAQYSPRPICGATRAPDNTDDDYWTEEIGEKGFAGVFAKKRGAHGRDYYIVASCGAPLLGQDTIASIASPVDGAATTVTWSAVADDRPLLFWKNAAYRNACRVAHRVSEAMGVSIETQNEYGTFRMYPNSEAERVTALPEHVQFVSSIAKSTAPSTAVANMTVDTVAQYSHCAPISRSEKPYHLVAVSPFAGLVGMAVPKGAVPVGAALPTTTGRTKKSIASIASELGKETALEPEIQELIDTRYVWENDVASAARDLSAVDRLHPEAYRAFDSEFISSSIAPLVKVGVEKLRFETFEPVCMKVPTRRSRPYQVK